jgi:hypothetical protein
MADNISIIASPTHPSPVPAIGQGLALARGDLVRVLIDGARMASPRLLATALGPFSASAAGDQYASFHQGPDEQVRSVIAAIARSGRQTAGLG